MMRCVLSVMALLLATLSAPSTTAPLVAQVDSAVVTTQAVAEVEAPLPPTIEEGPMLPRAMRPFYHVFAAFALSWLLVLGYAVSVRRRMDQLEGELNRRTR